MDPVVAQVPPTVFGPWPRPERLFYQGFLIVSGKPPEIFFSGRRPFAQNAVFPMLLKGFAWSRGAMFFLADHPASPVKRKRIACYM